MIMVDVDSKPSVSSHAHCPALVNIGVGNYTQVYKLWSYVDCLFLIHNIEVSSYRKLLFEQQQKQMLRVHQLSCTVMYIAKYIVMHIVVYIFVYIVVHIVVHIVVNIIMHITVPIIVVQFIMACCENICVH